MPILGSRAQKKAQSSFKNSGRGFSEPRAYYCEAKIRLVPSSPSLGSFHLYSLQRICLFPLLPNAAWKHVDMFFWTSVENSELAWNFWIEFMHFLLSDAVWIFLNGASIQLVIINLLRLLVTSIQQLPYISSELLLRLRGQSKNVAGIWIRTYLLLFYR